MPMTFKTEYIRRRICNQIDGATVSHADAAIARAEDMLSKLVHYAIGDDGTCHDEDIARLAVEFARDMVREERLVDAAGPFVKFIERFERNPLRNVADDFYSIHDGVDGASLRLSELRQLREAVRSPSAAMTCPTCRSLELDRHLPVLKIGSTILAPCQDAWHNRTP